MQSGGHCPSAWFNHILKLLKCPPTLIWSTENYGLTMTVAFFVVVVVW